MPSATPVPTPTPAAETFRPKDLRLLGRIQPPSANFSGVCLPSILLETSSGRRIKSAGWQADGSFDLQADLYSVNWGDLPLVLKPHYDRGDIRYVGKAVPIQMDPKTDKQLILGKFEQAQVMPVPSASPWDIAILPRADVQGHVYYTDGQQVANARIEARSTNSTVSFERVIHTNEIGAYALNNVPYGVPIEVKISVCGKVLRTRTFTALTCNSFPQIDFGVDALLLNAAQPGDQPFEHAAFAIDRAQIPSCSAESKT